MTQFKAGCFVHETRFPEHGTAVVLYQCGSGGIQSPGAEPDGHDVTVLRWDSDGEVGRLPTADLTAAPRPRRAEMTALLESCPDTAAFIRLVRGAIQAMFAEDTDGDPAELTALLANLYDAEESAQALDDATA